MARISKSTGAVCKTTKCRSRSFPSTAQICFASCEPTLKSTWITSARFASSRSSSDSSWAQSSRCSTASGGQASQASTSSCSRSCLPLQTCLARWYNQYRSESTRSRISSTDRSGAKIYSTALSWSSTRWTRSCTALICRQPTRRAKTGTSCVSPQTKCSRASSKPRTLTKAIRSSRPRFTRKLRQRSGSKSSCAKYSQVTGIYRFPWMRRLTA